MRTFQNSLTVSFYKKQLYILPWCFWGPYSSLKTEQRNSIQVIRITWLYPSGYQSKPGRTPSRPPLVHAPPPGKMQIGTSLYFEVRGHSSDHRWMWRPFLALLRICEVRQPRYRPMRNIRVPIITSARVENRQGRYNQDTIMADRYGVVF
jgi:hypothetical protein